MIRAFFVYGTLKTGQCRCPLWPRQPIKICSAWTHAALFGRSDYPAMRQGNDRVAGEVWQFGQDDLPAVIAALDQIEGTNQPGQHDLYIRVVVDTWQIDDQPLQRAYTYLYATDPSHDGFERIRPGVDQFARWPCVRGEG